jgi:glutamyl-tRNA synthetase
MGIKKKLKSEAGMKQIRGRFAPSPTGLLHLGNARTALVAWLHTRSQQGQFILRIEDLDSQRSKPCFRELNCSELRWLGLDWDEGPDCGGAYEPYLQSLRHSIYQDLLNTLQPWLTQCYLSRKDLQTMASAPHGPIEGYGLRERALNQSLLAAKNQPTKQPSLRLLGPQTEVRFEDLLHGSQAYSVGDFVLLRADGEWAYQLAVVADDLAMAITEIVRGDDLLPSTAAQVWIYQLLGQSVPEYLHLPLLHDACGQRLAKRSGKLSLTELRQNGLKPEAVIGFLAYSLGLIDRLECLSLTELLPNYQLQKLNTKPYLLQAKDLNWLGLLSPLRDSFNDPVGGI